MNNKAFTLIELIGAVTILAVIALIAFPSILNSIKKTNNQIDKSMEKVIISAANQYVNEHKAIYPKVAGSKPDIKVRDNNDINDDLCDFKYLSEEFCEKNAEKINNAIVEVNVVNNNGYYKYEFTYQSS